MTLGSAERLLRSIAALAYLAFFSSCLGTDLGVQGGSRALSATFSGISEVDVLSPSSTVVKWNTLPDYTSYNIYISTQDAPIGTSVFNSFTVAGLKPGTNYSFSVAGVRSDGSQDGISKQISVSTWTSFVGPTSAAATDSADIKVAWNYFSGPTFQVFYNIGAPPTAGQLAGAPNASSQSNTGTTVGGLQPNTTYYFSVIAKYPDGTTNLQALNVSASTATAQTSGNYGLVTLPTITTPASVLSTAYPVFTTSGGPATYQYSFYQGSLSSGDSPASACKSLTTTPVIAQGTGNQAITATAYLPLGLNTVNVQIRDTTSGACAYAVLSNIQSSANPATLIPSVTATTPTSLSPLPTIAAPSLQLGNFPSFTVSGALPGYKTELHYVDTHGNDTIIGTVTGNGTIKTLSSAPLPRGTVTLNPKVTYNGQVAYLSPISVRIKAVDNLPTVGPTDINGGGFGGGMGATMITGDFNCDGYPDLAVAAPFGAFGPPPASGGFTGGNGWNDNSEGAVAVYYGSSNGLTGFDYHDGIRKAITPVTAPTGLNPLLIPAPATPANPAYAYGRHFGYSLAAGNINGVSVGGKACSDLVVGAPGDFNDGWMWSAGAVYVYYGAPGGLQVTPYSYEGITCNQPGSYVCGTSKLSIPPGTTTRSYGYFGGWGGLGTSVAVGDFNGDGYDDIAVGFPEWTDPDTTSDPYVYTGAVMIYWGTANGAAPSPQPILLPAHKAGTNYSYMGTSVAFGYVSDAPSPGPYSGSTTNRKKDLLIGVPNLSNSTGAGGVVWVQGTANIQANLDDPVKSHLLSGYAIIQPPQCWPSSPKYLSNTTCGYTVASADMNQDGYDDILFTGPWLYAHYSYWPYTGAIFAYYGQPTGPFNYATAPVGNATTCTSPNAITNCNPHYYYRTDDYPYWNFGIGLHVLGDTVGDGYPRIGIGAPGASPAHNAANYTYNGMAYIYSGSAYGLTSAGATSINLNSSANGFEGMDIVAADFRNMTFGVGTSCNGKKCPDVVVGAPGESTGAGFYGHGGVHLLQNGGNGLSGTITADSATAPLIPSKPTTENANLAHIVGDLNGDGYADVATPVFFTGPQLTPSWQKSGENYRWGVAVYYGSANGLITIGSTGKGPSYSPVLPTDPLFISDLNPAYSPSIYFNGSLGRFVLPTGDMNGDGFADLAIGYNNYMYFFYGSANGLITTPLPLASPASTLDPKVLTAGTWVGMYTDAMGTHGDFNGDGYSDIAMVRTWQDLTDPIMIIYGSANGPVTGGAILNVKYPGYPSSNSQNNAVRTPTCSGSYPSAICQPLEICNGDTGSICGDLVGDPKLALMPYGSNPSWRGIVGYLMSPGDLDKDGTDDLVVANEYDNTLYAPQYQGAAFIFYGSTNGGLDPHRWAKLLITPEYVPDPYANRYLGDGYDGYGSVTKAYDVNGDGINDFVVSSLYETTGPNGVKNYVGGVAYIIYGINGGYKTLSNNPAVSCTGGGYPCTVTLTMAAGNTPDFSPVHMVENVNNSCDPSGSGCNPMRFYPYNTNYWYWEFGSGAVGLGDITGDGFGEVAISAQYRQPNGAVIIYSGSQSGLQVANQPTTQPSCTGGVCTPYLVVLPSDPSYTGYPSYMYYNVHGWSEAGDVDKDGKRDFLISSYWLHDPAGNGFSLGGWFLFH